MRHFAAVALERHTEYTGPFATEPFETAWASEAIFFIRVEDITGESPIIRAKVQISADGLNWLDEGAAFPAISAKGDYFVRVSHFGGWLRLAGEIQGSESRFQATIHLVLKE